MNIYQTCYIHITKTGKSQETNVFIFFQKTKETNVMYRRKQDIIEGKVEM